MKIAKTRCLSCALLSRKGCKQVLNVTGFDPGFAGVSDLGYNPCTRVRYSTVDVITALPTFQCRSPSHSLTLVEVSDARGRAHMVKAIACRRARSSACDGRQCTEGLWCARPRAGMGFRGCRCARPHTSDRLWCPRPRASRPPEPVRSLVNGFGGLRCARSRAYWPLMRAAARILGAMGCLVLAAARR